MKKLISFILVAVLSLANITGIQAITPKEASAATIFASDSVGSASGNGTREKPYTFTTALSVVPDGGTIKIIGGAVYTGYSDDPFDASAPNEMFPAKDITIDGEHLGTTLSIRYSLVMQGNLTIKNISMYTIAGSDGSDLRRIYCNGYDLTMNNISTQAAGLISAQQIPTILGGSPTKKTTNRDQKITLDSGKFDAIFAGGEGVTKGNVSISISGTARQNQDSHTTMGIYASGIQGGTVEGNVKIEASGFSAGSLFQVNGTGAPTTVIFNEAILEPSILTLVNIKNIALRNNTSLVSSSTINYNFENVEIDSSSMWKVNNTQSITKNLTGQGVIDITNTAMSRVHITGELQGDLSLRFSGGVIPGTYVTASATSPGSLSYTFQSSKPPFNQGSTLFTEVVGNTKNWNIKDYTRKLSKIDLTTNIDDGSNTIVLNGGINDSVKRLYVNSYDQYGQSYYNTVDNFEKFFTIKTKGYEHLFDWFQPNNIFEISSDTNIIFPAGDVECSVAYTNSDGTLLVADTSLRLMVKPTVTLLPSKVSASIDETVILNVDLAGAKSFLGRIVFKNADNEKEIFGEIAADEKTLEVAASTIKDKKIVATFIPTDPTYYVANTSETITVNVQGELTPITSLSLTTEISLSSSFDKQLVATYAPTNTTDTLSWSSANDDIATVDKNGLVTAITPGTTTITVTSTSGKSATCTVYVRSYVKLNFSSMILNIGDDSPLKPSSDSTLLTWESLDMNVATVDANGLVTAIGPGSTTITVTTLEGAKATCTIHVVSPITSVTLNSTSIDLEIGSIEFLIPTILPTNTTDDRSLTWSSDNTSIATVDTSGKVTAITAGIATITVTTINGKKATCSVTVLTPITSITLDVSSLDLAVGNSHSLVPTILPSNATGDASLSWVSDNTSIASIDASGKITAIAPGKATITVTTKNGKSASCSITVSAPITSVSLDTTSITLDTGKSRTLVPTILPSNATGDTSLSWSSDNPAVATVDNLGKVIAKAPGNATITVVTKNSKKTTCNVKVSTTILITSVSLDATSITLDTGNSRTLVPTVLPSNATGNTSLSWSSNNPAVATVDTSGKVIAKAPGNAIITVVTKNGKKESCTVTVLAPMTSIKLSTSSMTLTIGTSKSLIASILPSNTTDNKSLSWSSNNTAVATVDGAGKVLAKSPGSASITATTKNGKKASCTVTVLAPITSIRLNTSSMVLNINNSASLIASILPSNTTDNKSLSWSSNNTAVATVDGTGKVLAKSPGSANITVTTRNGKKASCTIKVNKTKPDITYQTHIQNVGWQSYSKNGQSSGTSNRSLRLEGIKIQLLNNVYGGGIQYRTHVQNIGWQNYASNNSLSGTSAKSLRLEAIQIGLTGGVANYYDVYYRIHAQNFGWMDWAKNGAMAGTAGYGYRLEAIQIVLVEKGGKAPGNTKQPYTQNYINYQTHVQNIGWQGQVFDGNTAGTSGKSLRLESIKIGLSNPLYSGDVLYRTHIQNIGWESSYKKNGAMSGTSGKGLRLEAIEIKLSGNLEKNYDIYYRVHAQNFGWMGWAKNGASAGTAGYAYRLEGIQIVLVKKGQPAPGSTLKAYAKR